MQSITRCLVELKTLDNRINKLISSTTFITYKTKNKNYNYSEDDFKKGVLSDYQSLTDLIERRQKIKNAIVLSNATTEVEIAGKKMTVSQAIEFKNTIAYKINLLESLKRQRQHVTIETETHKMRVQQKIDENVRIICGKDSKPDAQVIQTVSEGIAKGDPIEVFDPLSIDKVIKDMEETIEDFNANVDFVLSESNALTTVSL
jgi:hypothetical protein